MTDDTSSASRSTTRDTRIVKSPEERVRIKETPETSDPANSEDEEEESASYERHMFDAKTSIEFIPVLNGQDDIGVEGFIKRAPKTILPGQTKIETIYLDKVPTRVCFCNTGRSPLPSALPPLTD
ncbi:uncharacterized protein LOC126927121 [Bombus affinis]|uniref:uncharacterized protein LOC126927121 n=1 Tax=Bombus affinis TaxID=309941 RepID=UPI0021B7690B|nr:uncharacterized protein LOC126927121 [Bombus affinis]